MDQERCRTSFRAEHVVSRRFTSPDCLRYMHDYGGPAGFRLAVRHPTRVRGLVIQNAVANAAGRNLDVSRELTPFWQRRDAETEGAARQPLYRATTRGQYTQGSTRLHRLSRDAWPHDQASLDRPGNGAIQLALLHDYSDNLAQYSAWKEYLLRHRPKALIAWDRGDPYFSAQAVGFYRAVPPDAELHLYGGGHFALATQIEEIPKATLSFLGAIEERG
ncbi:alpha/beta fold hydrolase [Elioraea rosea]|uniref:alpha/beta fold hydrolase n=1 Tax=Elioraea rosea TaxID=2492390 RepID=UPI001183848C|nr:alpha/beta fold hydrolase [Elioraea rosea]